VRTGATCHRAERRMAPLSRELAGLILPHDHYGSHLDKDCKTIDEQLEAANFAFAGKALAEVWSSMVIDTHPVIADYIEPSASEMDASSMKTASAQWRSVHVRESQYFTQAVKCDDRSCCRPPRSSFFKLFPSRFLPPPVPLLQTSDGLKAPEIGKYAEAKFASVFLTNTVIP
jgi:hypothetical protein